MNRRIIKDMIALMQKDSSLIKQALDLLLVARNLERIGDHATNIAENAIFVVKGLDVRHHHE